MGKKIQEAMDAERPKFLAGAAENGVGKEKALEVWNLLDKFANYGFNKSHAAAYGLVSYQTAWLKANYPVEFMASVMNLDIQLTDKLAVYKQEVERSGITLLPPDINRSEARFAVEEHEDGLAIRYALGALKNVGIEAMASIVREREANGPFRDVFDVMARVDPRMVNKRALENLIRAGAFDAMESNRQRLFNSADTLLSFAQARAADRDSTQVSLFGDDPDAVPPPRLSVAADWQAVDRLTQEHGAVGFYLSGHPLDGFMAALERKRFVPFTQLERMAGVKPTTVRIAGTVLGRQERKSARGNRFAFVQLSDPTGLFEASVFSETLTAIRDLLETGNALALTIEATKEGEQLRMRILGAQPVEDAVADASALSLKVYVNDPTAFEAMKTRLARSDRKRGSGPITVVMHLADEDCEVEFTLPGEYELSSKVQAALKDAAGVAHVEQV
jgi:DNA polymerase-3 subunit alpha